MENRALGLNKTSIASSCLTLKNNTHYCMLGVGLWILTLERTQFDLSNKWKVVHDLRIKHLAIHFFIVHNC